MGIKKNVSYPKKGMQRDKHPSELTEQEYSFAMNNNIQDEHGNGPIFLQNESSNIKCSGFKQGYVVIGHKYDISDGNAYFFLTNPTTGCSEIGVIKGVGDKDSLSAVESECGCDIKVVLEDPLEDTSQTSYCTYETIITDCCGEEIGDTKCLDFDINYPIKETNVHIKNETSGKVLYFTDFKNPQRRIDISNTDQYYEIDNVCDDPTPACLQCDKIRMFPLFDRPCIEAEKIEFGGNLKAGVYQAFVAYCTITGVELSDYYSPTNPVSIWDKNQSILTQTNLDYQTSSAIGLSVSDIDDKFEYYKVVVVYRSGLDTATSYKSIGVYPTSTDKVTISSLTDADDLVVGGRNQGESSLQAITRQTPMYTNAKGMAEANNQLWQYGLKTQRELNLQPVVNLMGAFVKWITVQAKEDLYEDGVAVANYRGYMRDEVYPLSIKFFMQGGYETANFPFIARPAIGTEKDTVVDGEGNSTEDNLNVESILEYVQDCQDVGRTERWQYENTATVDAERCTVPSYQPDTEVVTRTKEFECTVRDGSGDIEVVNTLGPLEVCVDDVFDDIVDYINQNKDDIIAEADPEWAAVITALESTYPGDTCTPEIPSNCDAPVETGIDVFAIDVASQDIEYYYDDYDEYTRIPQPNNCPNVEIDPQNNDPVLDQLFVDSYMSSGDEVWQRPTSYSNIDCLSASYLITYTGAPTVSLYYFQNMGEIGGFSNLQFSSHSAEPTDPSTAFTSGFPTDNPGYTDKVHRNALWFKVDFNGRERAIVEISTMSDCENDDDNTGESIRVTAFPDCSSAHIPSYSRIIEDLTLNNDQDKFIELDAADFGGTSGTAYLAIDTEMIQTSEDPGGTGTVDSYRLRPPCGCFSIYEREVQAEACVTFDGLTLGKKIFYESSCDFEVPQPTDCDPIPYETGKFSYWESSSKYPCNPELYNSQDMLTNIEISDIPVEYQTDFENYYATVSGSNYSLTSAADFQDKPIRHYKFPCSTKVPFMATQDQDPGSFKESVIYPIGFKIDNEIINAFLDIAVKNNLITVSERAKIESYEIYRGDRRIDKSIISKGLLFDTYESQETGAGANQVSYYPNYPLNALGPDLFNDTLLHPYGDQGNTRYTFHSPDIHFYKPTLPNEMKVEGYVYGSAGVYFDEVLDHPKYAVLGRDAYDVAAVLANAEVAFDVLLQTGDWMIQATSSDLYASIPGIIAAVGFIVGLAIEAFFQVGEKTSQWIENFRNLGTPYQFAYYQAAIGHYSWFEPNTVADSMYRGVPTRNYIGPGMWNITNEAGSGQAISVNNLDGEDSAFLYLGDDSFKINYPTYYITYDNEGLNPSFSSRMNYPGIGRSPRYTRNTASPYVSLKQYLPNQYGSITSVEWTPTGYCGNLNDVLECDPIFGGDIFISRFALKRRHSFFTTTAFDLASLTPYKYSDYFNINPDSNAFRFYIDYLFNDEISAATSVFPIRASEYRFDYQPTNNVFYQEPPSKFYLFSYGFPYFLVESVFNCNYRYAKDQPGQDFYPRQSDVISLTQERDVSIREPNWYYYNPVYSLSPLKTGWRTLPVDFEQDFYDKLAFLENSVIYSEKDVSETSTVDPWLVYKPLNLYQFPTQYGDLIDMDGIESEQILGRFEHGFTIFGAVDQIADRFTPETGSLGTGGIFAGRNINFNETDLGYAGTQHTAKVSCKFGHFWADARRGKVFQLQPNGQGLKEITSGIEKWLKDQLPFKITKYFPELTKEEIDNNYKGLGLTMGWDDRLNRVFLTKLDFVPKDENIQYSVTQGFYVEGEGEEVINIDLTDEDYFENCSWTVGYSPLLEGWISYYSFKPNYYVAYNNYFQTGINETVNTNPDSSLWSHLPFLSSYQVFYGVRYPWIIEYIQKSQLTNSVLHDIEYWLDVRKYYNKYDYTDIYGQGFNKAIIYNNHQNSGLLKLTHQRDNDMSQQVEYPKHNSDSIETLQSEINGKWSFNYFYNLIRNEKSGLPIWINDCANLTKELNNKLLDYRNTYKDRLRGDYFKVRLIQDEESRYKMIHRFSTDTKEYYNQ